MIEINLLPGSGKKSRSRSAGVNVAGAFSGITTQIRDPWLLGAVASVLVAAFATGALHFRQQSQQIQLDEQFQAAEQDSIRYTAVIREKRKAEARRDSVIRQVELIKAIDDKRFIWPHLLDEVSRALPPFTWVSSVAQTNVTGASLAAMVPPGGGEVPDSLRAMAAVNFRLIGITVDIQALTRFMKLLEASPFVENVQLVKSTLVMVEGKEATEFQLDAAYQAPDPSAIRTIPVSLTVR